MWTEASNGIWINLDHAESLVIDQVDDKASFTWRKVWRVVAHMPQGGCLIGKEGTMEEAQQTLSILTSQLPRIVLSHTSTPYQKYMELRARVERAAEQMEKMGQYTSPGVNDMANRCCKLAMDALHEPDRV